MRNELDIQGNPMLVVQDLSGRNYEGEKAEM